MRNASLLGRISIFLGLLFVFQSGFHLLRDTAIERLLIDEVTVKPSAWMLSLLNPHSPIVAVQHKLLSPGVELSVRNGCEGWDGIFLLLSAIFAFPAGWRNTLFGALIGMSVMYLLNQLRIIGLFYLASIDHKLFLLMHGLVAPVIIVALGSVVFMAYLHIAVERHAQKNG